MGRGNLLHFMCGEMWKCILRLKNRENAFFFEKKIAISFVNKKLYLTLHPLNNPKG